MRPSSELTGSGKPLSWKTLESSTDCWGSRAGDYLERLLWARRSKGNRRTPLEQSGMPFSSQPSRSPCSSCPLWFVPACEPNSGAYPMGASPVRFCLLMNRENNVLVLDEPTNHLDVDAKKNWNGLWKVQGSILMVCHRQTSMKRLDGPKSGTFNVDVKRQKEDHMVLFSNSS